jgi:hypothetical protein
MTRRREPIANPVTHEPGADNADFLLRHGLSLR